MNWIDLAMADTSTQGRIRAMEAFISAWYGPWKPEHGIDGVDARTDLPDALRWFYGRHGRRKELITYNNLAGPDDNWPPYIEGGAPPAGDRRVFLSENQGVYVWGHDPGEADPRVWCALNETGGAWAAEEETLAGFMFQLLLCELHGPNHTIAYWIDREQYELIASRFQSLLLAPR